MSYPHQIFDLGKLFSPHTDLAGELLTLNMRRVSPHSSLLAPHASRVNVHVQIVAL